MPKPPSKYGLERKYKSWRKGKSAKAKSKGSLKQQLRGKERLLAKLPETESERRQEIEQQIQELKTEIEGKQIVEKERQNAKDSHGLRFLERQRLTRNERSLRKLLAAASTREEKTRFEAELQRIALDQVYVAHFPHDMRYIPLFRNGVRMVDVNARKLARRATTRKRILKNLGEDRVKWIAADQYERLPLEWSVEMEKKTFAAAVNGDTAEAEIIDNRFAASLPQHAALLEAAEQAEIEARKELEEQKEPENIMEGTDSSDESSEDNSSSDDEANPLTESRNETKQTTKEDESIDSESSDGDRSSDSEAQAKLPQANESSSDEDSSSDSDSSDEDETSRTLKLSNEISIAEEFDDFLVPATNDVNVFDKARHDAPQNDFVSGDKSKGWATQRQRPGQFKKRRTR